MDSIGSLLVKLAAFLPTLTMLALTLAVLALVNGWLRRRWQNNPDLQFRFQLIMLGLTFAGVLAVIVSLPINDGTRGQLLSLIGILLSAAIALSSTTFIGNVMAGMMLKVVRSARPGDFITVQELTGRITEMGLLHTEIQTEFRDLVTVPNMFMVTQPMQVVRASGTIITAEVSLGYDVSHTDASRILCEAAEKADLAEAFVHVRELGDFSVTYRVAGLLEDVKSLISARSRLRESMLDSLHSSDIEIVSPNFMNTRPVADEQRFIPAPSRTHAQARKTQAEDVIFDKADEAASVEDIRKAIELVDAELQALKDSEGDEIDAVRKRLDARKIRLTERLAVAEAARKAAELAEKTRSSD